MDACDLISVAHKYGTPVHVVSKKRLLDNCKHSRAALASLLGGGEVFYSYKTNCVPGILRLIHAQGIGAEVISPYELWVALRLGVPGEKIIYNGPHKTRESLETAIRHSVKLINVDSLTDIRATVEVCRAHGLVANIGVRLCPTVGWSAQFGLNMNNGEATEGFRLIKESQDCLQLHGLHMHLGSQITDKSLFQKAIAELAAFLSHTEKSAQASLRYLDLGGGFGVPTVREVSGIERRLSSFFGRPFRPPSPDGCPSIEEFGSVIAETLGKYASLFPNRPPTVIVEPGRAITSNTQVLLLSVRVMKLRKPPIVILDGGKMNITFPTAFEYHEVLAANKMRELASCNYKLVGRTCTPSDVVYDNKTLPTLAEGDVIAVMDAGAYFTSFSSDFAFPRPSIVLTDGGKETLLRERETFEGMAARDVPT
jgi:diaminopimelate decarboxylase